MKPNQNFTLAQMKDYVRKEKLNHPQIKLSMKRADIVKGLKKAGHWNEVAPKAAKAAPKAAKAAPKENYEAMAKHIQRNNKFNHRIQQVVVSGKGQVAEPKMSEVTYGWDGLNLYTGSIGWNREEQRMILGRGAVKAGTYKSIPNLEKWRKGILRDPVKIKLNNKQLKLSPPPRTPSQMLDDEAKDKKLVKKVIQKIKSLKKTDLDNFLNFNNDELEKIAPVTFYGAWNWVTLDGVRDTKTKVIDIITNPIIPRDNNREFLNQILKQLNNIKTSF